MTNEVEIQNSNMIPLDSFFEFQKSICNVNIQNGSGTGFLIKIQRKENKKKQKKMFHCLITCEHVIEESIIQNKKKILINYDYQKKEYKTLPIEFNKGNKDKRFKRSYKYLGIDVTVVQIYEKEIEDKYFYFIDENNIDILKDFSENYQIMRGNKFI